MGDFIMAVTVSDIKTLLGITVTTFDTQISGHIDNSYNYLNCDYNRSTGTFTEHGIIESDFRLILSVKTDDVVLTSFYISDELDDIANLEKISRNVYAYGSTAHALNFQKDLTSYVRYKITYTSAKANSYIDKIVKDLTIWEFRKSPLNEDFITKNSKRLGNDVITSYKSDKDFFDYIDRQIMTIFLQGI